MIHTCLTGDWEMNLQVLDQLLSWFWPASNFSLSLTGNGAAIEDGRYITLEESMLRE